MSKRKLKTQDNNGGERKIARMEAELKRNPNNVYTSQRLSELKKLHKLK